MDAPSLAPRYLDSCTRHRVQPNAEVLSWFSKAQAEMASCRKCHIVISLDQLRDTDIFPLTDAFMEIGSSAIDKVDILHKSPSPLNAEHLFALMHAINLKLHVVDIQDRFLGEDFLSNLSQGGISCRVLNLWSTQVQKLNMVGRFTHLHTLNLDFCASITSFHKDCFSCMPNLMRLSMCETRIANLWTTTAVLSSLPSLVELRFQKCLCCHDSGPCTSLYGKEMNLVSDKVDSAQCNLSSCGTPQIVYDEKAKHKVLDEVGQVDGLLSLKDSSIAQEFHGTNDGISGGTEVKLSTQFTRINFSTNKEERLQNEITDNDKVILTLHKQKLRSRNVSFKKYVSHHPSPICYEKYYREYMIVSLPRLEVLDNLPIQHVDKEIAKTIVSSYYENLPYQWQKKESITAVLHQREMGKASFYHPKSFKVKHSVSSRKGQHFFLRSLTAAKLRSTVWPVVQSVSQISHLIKEGTRLRPRQFEYNPLDPALMAFGTLDGDIVVINHENGKVAACVSSTGNSDSILGLCWLKKYPSKLIAGSDNGSLKLFDINFMPPKVPDFSFSYDAATFDDFEQLTSVHVNSTDDRFLASGYRRDIALYDTASGKRIQLFRDLHREPINVAKFANHSPFLFATSSFDRDVKMWDLRQNPLRPCYTTSSSRENVMVCFSPDDHYLLVSAVDNEVKQLLACDGRLQMKFEITPTGSAHNYTRSYYMNGRDYIISGSCDEHVVRICSAQTGRRLRDFVLEDGNSRNFMYVQSLRGDPFRDFHFSVLAASTRASSKCEIMKVNLLASEDHKDQSYNQSCLPSYSLGG